MGALNDIKVLKIDKIVAETFFGVSLADYLTGIL